MDKRSHRRDRSVDEIGVLHLIEDNTGGNPAYVGRHRIAGSSSGREQLNLSNLVKRVDLRRAKAALVALALLALALGGVLLWSAPAEAQTVTVLVKNRDCILYPGVGTFVLIRPAQTFCERINIAKPTCATANRHTAVPSSTMTITASW